MRVLSRRNSGRGPIPASPDTSAMAWPRSLLTSSSYIRARRRREDITIENCEQFFQFCPSILVAVVRQRGRYRDRESVGNGHPPLAAPRLDTTGNGHQRRRTAG